MERFYKANEVAQLFNVPVSTLHYWESMGLFRVGRNKENQYREYRLDDILNIWEIILYREQDLSIQEIREMRENDVAALEEAYAACEENIEQKIRQLQEKKEKIKLQKKLIKMLDEAREGAFHLSEPDFSICKVDSFEMESMKVSLKNPYTSVMFVQAGEEKKYIRGLVLRPKNGESVLWERRQGATYIEFLLKMNVEDASDNNIEEARKQAGKLGYQTGDVIGRYLLIATEKGKRMEYFRAWMEVVP